MPGKISPFSESRKIPGSAVNTLARSIKQVLKNAEKTIRKKAPQIIGGEVRDFLRIHNAANKKSPGGATIKTRESNKRKTYYTDEQILYA